MKEAFEKIKKKIQEKIDKIQGVLSDYDFGLWEAYEDVKKIVSEVEAEYGNGWIPCSERLPENGRCVICHAKENDEDKGEMFYGWYCGDSWSLLRFDSENFPLEYEDRVVAWHPLPEEYKQERSEG